MPNDDVISNLNYVVSWKKVPSKLKTFEKLLSKYLPMVDVKSSIEKNIYNGDYIDFHCCPTKKDKKEAKLMAS